MMSYAWPIVVRGGLLDPRGYGPLYALMIASHRLLRYASPLLHVLAALATLALLRRGRAYAAAAAVQAALLAAAAAGGRVRSRPLLVARYYVLTTAALAAGLYDWLRHGTEVGWEAPGGHAVRRSRYLRLAPQARARRAGRRRRAACSRPAAGARGDRDPARDARPPGLPPAARRPRRRGRSSCTSCARWSAAPRTWARAWPSTRATTGSRGSARGCGARRSTRCRTWSTCCAARCRWSARGRPCRCRSTATTTASAAGSTRCPGITGWAQVNGRASLPWHERIELDLWYVEHASLRLDLRILVRTARMAVTGAGLYRGETGGLARAAAESSRTGGGEPGDAEDDRRGGRGVAHHGLQRLQPARPARPRAARPDPRHRAPRSATGPRPGGAAAALRPPRRGRPAARRGPRVTRSTTRPP